MVQTRSMAETPQIVSRYPDYQDLIPRLARILEELSSREGLSIGVEERRLMIYDADKVWRVFYTGTYHGAPATIRVDGMDMQIPEDLYVERFRAVLRRSRATVAVATAEVRPPHVLMSEAFEAMRGYGFTVEESVQGEAAWNAKDDPAVVSEAFMRLYRVLRVLLREPFLPAPEDLDAQRFHNEQYAGWLKVARAMHTDHTERVHERVRLLYAASRELLAGKKRTFQHAHLAPENCTRAASGEYVLRANHFWGWRQPLYDVAFGVWQQWLSLPVERCTMQEVARIADIWKKNLQEVIGDEFGDDAWRAMLLNRVYGAVLLDLPPRITDEAQRTTQLEEALLDFGANLLS